MPASAGELFYALPPVTRTLLAATAATSLLVHSGLLNFYWVVFHPEFFIHKFPPQLWRIATSFFVTGGGLGFFFDLYFLYTYGGSIENSGNRFTVPGDFFVFVIFSASIILLLAGVLLGGVIFTSALVLSFTYIYAQDNRGKKVGFLIFTIPVEYLPWALVASAIVSGGPMAALHQVPGLVAGHLYDFLTKIYPTFGGGRNWIVTPMFVQRWFGANQRQTVNRAYGTAVRPGQAQSSSSQAPSSGGGWTSGFSSGWKGRGKGQRLGGD